MEETVLEYSINIHWDPLIYAFEEVSLFVMVLPFLLICFLLCVAYDES